VTQSSLSRRVSDTRFGSEANRDNARAIDIANQPFGRLKITGLNPVTHRLGRLPSPLARPLLRVCFRKTKFSEECPTPSSGFEGLPYIVRPWRLKTSFDCIDDW